VFTLARDRSRDLIPIGKYMSVVDLDLMYM
jgi:hypothetical protein